MSESLNLLKSPKKILGLGLLASILNVSEPELKAYIANPGSISEIILRRLAFLIEVVDILKDAYNDRGIRQWFLRKRIQLNDKSPVEILRENWNPENTDPHSVLELAKGINI